MKYIHRRDRDERHSHGWFVRICSLKGSRFFGDSKHGGRDAALRAAVAHRDRALQAAGISLSDRTVVTGQRRGATGIQGIHIFQNRARRWYVVSYSLEPGRRQRRLFPIPDDQAGARQALRDAVAFRREQEKVMYGATIKANWRRSFAEVCG